MRSRQAAFPGHLRRVPGDGDRAFTVTRRGATGYDPAGAHALTVVQVVAIATTLVFFGSGAVTSVTGDQQPDLPVRIWILPAIAALVVLIVCRDPQRRVPELSYTISAAAGVPTFLAALSFIDGVDPFLTGTFLIGVVTLVLSYLWRGDRGTHR